MAEMRKTSATRRRSSRAVPVVHSIKCVVLGDGDVGKSSMLVTYLNGRFPLECPPGPIDGHAEFDHLTTTPTSIVQENIEVKITIVDTYGQDEYDKLREKVCGTADVYILCFDVSRPETLERMRHHWIPEMRKYCTPQTPFIVAGLKTDLRTQAQSDSGSDMTKFVTYGEGLKEAADLGSAHYVECSAKNNTAGVKRVLERAAQAALTSSLPPELKRSSCVVS
ncbi:Rho GTPase protein rac1 [Bulinus truncatus]|nr:Rho GTPase protein rac1 [Bulinus truncatus]